jgi:hypothetical protein
MAARAQSGIVLFGDVVASRDVERSPQWLRSLRKELDGAYGDRRLAAFEFTQGDELQGLLAPHADPFAAIVRAAVRDDRLPMRWVIARGEVDPGRGPATQRSGPAFLVARELAGRARRRRELISVRTGDPPTDELLDGVAPALGRLLAELTPRQRAIAGLLLVDGLTQADAARRLGIRAPTVSVAADRARVREIEGLWQACRSLVARGLAAGKRS